MNDRSRCTSCRSESFDRAALNADPVQADLAGSTAAAGRHRVYTRTAFVLVLLGTGGWLLWEAAGLSLRLTFAEEQMERFEECRTRALRSDVAGASRCLKCVVGYYPSGTKQPTGTRLDRMVERERSRAIQDIITYLRGKTGMDLGDDPEGWIGRFAEE